MNGIDDQLASRAWVRNELEELRHELETHLRSRRVTIVDGDDGPLIVLRCSAGVATIEVRAPGPDGGVGVELSADASPADRAATLSLTKRGSVVAAFTVVDSDDDGICRLVFDDSTSPRRLLVIDADGTRFV